jgi:hypothetical protein
VSKDQNSSGVPTAPGSRQAAPIGFADQPDVEQIPPGGFLSLPIGRYESRHTFIAMAQRVHLLTGSVIGWRGILRQETSSLRFQSIASRSSLPDATLAAETIDHFADKPGG